MCNADFGSETSWRFSARDLGQIVAHHEQLHLIIDRFEVAQFLSPALGVLDDLIIDARERGKIAPVHIGKADDHGGKPGAVAREMLGLQSRAQKNARVGFVLDPVQHFAKRRAARQQSVLDDEVLLARVGFVVHGDFKTKMSLDAMASSISGARHLNDCGRMCSEPKM